MINTTDERIEQLMQQVQVFASAWALVGGQFDSGGALKTAEEEKEALRVAIADELALAEAAGTALVQTEHCLQVANDVLLDFRIQFEVLCAEMGVAVEPHQHLFSRMIEAAKASAESARRYAWARDMLLGEDSAEADRKALALADFLLAGLDGDQAVDAAIAASSNGP